MIGHIRTENEKLNKVLNAKFKFTVQPQDHNPAMPIASKKKQNFGVWVTNRRTGERAKFPMSFGMAHTDLNPDKVATGLIESLYIDWLYYEDNDLLDGLGYDYQEKIQVKKAINEMGRKMERIGLDMIRDYELEV